jgi:hypothetical protein
VLCTIVGNWLVLMLFCEFTIPNHSARSPLRLDLELSGGCGFVVHRR